VEFRLFQRVNSTSLHVFDAHDVETCDDRRSRLVGELTLLTCVESRGANKLKFHESSFLARILPRISACRVTYPFSLPRAYLNGRPVVCLSRCSAARSSVCRVVLRIPWARHANLLRTPSRGCYEENAPAEFQLYRTTDARYPVLTRRHGSPTSCGVHGRRTAAPPTYRYSISTRAARTSARASERQTGVLDDEQTDGRTDGHGGRLDRTRPGLCWTTCTATNACDCSSQSD